MSEYQNSSLENNIKHLNMMFEISTIANQTDDVRELLAKLKSHCANIINSQDITFYLLENQRYKCILTDNNNLRNSEFVEGDEANAAFWDAVNKAKIISMKDENGAHLFKSFLEKNNILILNPSHVRVFFSNQVPICFCFIKEDEQTPIESETIANLNKIFDYIEPIIAKYHKRIKKDEEMLELQRSLHNISILYNISQAVNFIDDLKRLLQVIIQKALITLDAEKGSLMLYDYTLTLCKLELFQVYKIKNLKKRLTTVLFNVPKSA